MILAAVPEAAIDENGEAPAGKDDVRPSTRLAWYRSYINSIPQAEPVQFTSQHQFGSRIALL